MKKLQVALKRLSHPQVRRRLKIGLSVWGIAIIISLICKLAYDIGYFNAQSVIDEKIAAIPSARPVLTMDMAQRIVTGALKEDPNLPKTVVTQIFDNNQKLSSILIENNRQKHVAWIVDLRLFFMGDLFNDNGYNLTEAVANQYDIRMVNPEGQAALK